MNGEVRGTAHIRMLLSVVRKAHQKAKEEGKTLGRWVEDAIEEKLERNEKIEREQKKIK